jgi:hypothetical protein
MEETSCFVIAEKLSKRQITCWSVRCIQGTPNGYLRAVSLVISRPKREANYSFPDMACQRFRSICTSYGLSVETPSSLTSSNFSFSRS